MKRHVAALVVFIGTSLTMADAQAQGMFVFSNREVGHEAPVYDIDCQTPLGRGFFGQAYVGDTPDDLVPLEQPNPFIASGYFRQQSVYVPGPGDRQVYVQMRAWEAAAGPTYEAALEAGGQHGTSNITTVWAWASSGITPDVTDDFVSFCLVPEPSTLGLFVFAACFAFCRCLNRGKELTMRCVR